jgi:hypothetical protein
MLKPESELLKLVSYFLSTDKFFLKTSKKKHGIRNFYHDLTLKQYHSNILYEGALLVQ